MLFGLSIIVVIGVLKFHTFDLFAQIEVEKLQDRNRLIVRSILNEIERLQGTARDWAQFDDSYEFIQDLNQDYIDANLVPGVVDDLGVFGLLYLDLEFKTRYGMVQEPGRSLFQLISDQIEAERDRFLTPEAEGGKSILLYNDSADQFYWVVMESITDSEEKEPINGYLVMIKLMDAEFMEQMSTIFGAPIKIISSHNIGCDGCSQSYNDTTFCQRIDFLDNNKAALLITFKDDSRTHHLLIQSFVFRNLNLQLRNIFIQTLLALIVIGGVIVAAIVMILGRLVLSPIGKAASDFTRCAENKDMTTRLDITGPFEVKQMAMSANVMLDEIQSLNGQLQSMAQMDELTGISNKRHFYELYAKHFARAKRNNSSLGIFMIDIDHFKQFNDLYGHLAGDECLGVVAGVLKKTVSRTNDIVARFGGEEFVVVLDNVSASGLGAVCHNFSKALESAAIKHGRSSVSQIVTCSIGAISLIPPRTLESRELLSQVDQLLYRAKKNGRNRIELENRP
jgi:diguanylate cyclase (GGDEF)-like protein